MTIPFVIWFEGRSGSSLLVSLLDSHPDIRCRAEDFSGIRLDEDQEPVPVRGHQTPVVLFNGLRFQRRLAGLGQVTLGPTNEQTLGHLQELFAQPGAAAGFKFKYPRQHGLFPEIANRLLEQRDRIRLICLRRRNVLKRAISKQNLARVRQQSGKCNLDSLRSTERLIVDTRQVLDFCARVEQRQAGFDAWARQFSQACDVEYEDLLNRRTVVLQQISKFLDVDPAQILESDLVKSTGDRLSEAVGNYDQLVAALEGTPWEVWLSEGDK